MRNVAAPYLRLTVMHADARPAAPFFSDMSAIKQGESMEWEKGYMQGAHGGSTGASSMGDDSEGEL